MHKIVTKILEKKAVIGTWCVIPSVQAAIALAQGGLDFIIPDMIYGHYSLNEIQNVTQAAHQRSCSVFVRIADQSADAIQQALTTGCDGVAVSGVRYNDIWDVLERQKFPYAHHKSIAGSRFPFPFDNDNRYDSDQFNNVLKTANDQILPIILLQDVDSVTTLADSREVLAPVKIPDRVYYIDLFRLAQAMGYIGDPFHKNVLKKLEAVVVAIRQGGQIAGCQVGNDRLTFRILDMGVNFITYEADCALLQSATQQAVNTIASAIGYRS